jgi:hypothetical protein
MGYLETALRARDRLRGVNPVSKPVEVRKDEKLNPGEGQNASWGALSKVRWGPGLTDDDAPIVIPFDHWRRTVAAWPHDRWSAWHRRWGELAPPGSTAEVILEAQRLAFDEISADLKPRPHQPLVEAGNSSEIQAG